MPRRLRCQRLATGDADRVLEMQSRISLSKIIQDGQRLPHQGYRSLQVTGRLVHVGRPVTENRVPASGDGDRYAHLTSDRTLPRLPPEFDRQQAVPADAGSGAPASPAENV